MSGKATLTMRSAKTGAHYTFRFKRKNDFYWVTILTGKDYTYVGMWDEYRGFRLTYNSRMSEYSMPVKALRYALRHIMADKDIPECLELMHNGKCGKCGRDLTHPKSIELGLGPICRGEENDR